MQCWVIHHNPSFYGQETPAEVRYFNQTHTTRQSLPQNWGLLGLASCAKHPTLNLKVKKAHSRGNKYLLMELRKQRCGVPELSWYMTFLQDKPSHYRKFDLSNIGSVGFLIHKASLFQSIKCYCNNYRSTQIDGETKSSVALLWRSELKKNLSVKQYGFPNAWSAASVQTSIKGRYD